MLLPSHSTLEQLKSQRGEDAGVYGAHGSLLPVLWREEGADLKRESFSDKVVPLLIGKLQDKWRAEPGKRSLFIGME